MEEKKTSISPIVKMPNIPTQAAEQIIDLINRGVLKTGDRLPSEHNMTRMMGISRISLREAMKLLEARGYIEPQYKRGKFVRIPEEGEKTSIEDLLSVDQDKIWELLCVRRILDAKAAALACGCATSEEKKALRSFCAKAAQRGLARRVPIAPEGGKLYARFFDTLIESTHNTIFIQLRKSVDTLLLGAFPFSREKLSTIRGSAARIIEQLGALTDAIERNDPRAAEVALITHIEYLEKSLKKAIDHS
ncbi:MAG: FCD domain-containing protein [Desulfomonilia bacterium]|jgi:GntR family transcriptional repressor for pyruvate dehydrogenase complex|nr:GntR family transcriptional regulator [Deltaproteobacteria bacterium]MDX9760755.1 GntR family transcriptional regulator [Desulfomonilia bacterium]HPW69294.1 GntR family transcriptional regulator [Deltaproteobacteria bacterium]